MITLRRILKNKELYVHDKTIEERRIKYQMTVVPIPSFLDKAISRDSRVIHGREGSIWLKQIMYQHSRPIEKIETFDKLLKSKNL